MPASHTTPLPDPLLLRAGAAAALTGVGLGAFGAHGLETLLEAAGRVDTWETAVLYQLVHAVALVALSNLPGVKRRRIGWCFLIGILIFSGSLYLLCLSGITWLGAITPIGGVLFLVGWLLLLVGKTSE